MTTINFDVVRTHISIRWTRYCVFGVTEVPYRHIKASIIILIKEDLKKIYSACTIANCIDGAALAVLPCLTRAQMGEGEMLL